MAGGISVTVHLSTANVAHPAHSAPVSGVHADPSGLLPFTGLAVGILVLLAICLLLAGGALSWFGHSSARGI